MRWRAAAADGHCLSEDTQVLMADGGTRRIDDLAVGDRVVGTRQGPAYRHYAATEVRAVRRTRWRAHRTALVDGTVLISSGDHRLLTAHGWVEVRAGRSGLLTGDMLIGPGPATGEAPAKGSPVIRESATDVVTVDDLGVDLPMVRLTTGTGDLVANGVVSRDGDAPGSGPTPT